MSISAFIEAYLRDHYCAAVIDRWLAQNPPPAEWRSTRLMYAYTEMVVIPLTRVWWRLRRFR